MKAYTAEQIRIAENRIRRTAYTEQRNFIFDPAARSTALVGRGGGKSTALMLRLIFKMIELPNQNCLFIAATRDSAERLIWRDLKSVVSALNIVSMSPSPYSETKLMLSLPNGSRLILAGCDDKADIAKLRGITYHQVGIDEVGSIKPALLEELLLEVLGPRMVGTLSLIGTPGKQLQGMFFDVTREGSPDHRPWKDRDDPAYAGWTKWSSHKWSIKDGVDAGIAALQEIYKVQLAEKERNGWSDSNPRWRREMLGEWAADDTSNVYVFRPYDEAGKPYNVWEPELDARGYAVLPFDAKDTGYAIGLDVGWTDSFALTVFAFSYTDPSRRIYQVYEVNKKRQYAQAIAKLLIGEDLSHDRYGGIIGHIGWPDVLVGDFAGSGGALLEELRTVYGITVVPADKALRLKENSIELFNSDLYDGRIRVLKGSKLAEQLSSLQWVVDQWGKRTENKAQPNDQVDSALYARNALVSLLPPASSDPTPAAPSSATATTRHRRDVDDVPHTTTGEHSYDADSMYQDEW